MDKLELIEMIDGDSPTKGKAHIRKLEEKVNEIIDAIERPKVKEEPKAAKEEKKSFFRK